MSERWGKGDKSPNSGESLHEREENRRWTQINADVRENYGLFARASHDLGQFSIKS